jgi:hypothetical protein
VDEGHRDPRSALPARDQVPPIETVIVGVPAGVGPSGVTGSLRQFSPDLGLPSSPRYERVSRAQGLTTQPAGRQGDGLGTGSRAAGLRTLPPVTTRRGQH